MQHGTVRSVVGSGIWGGMGRRTLSNAAAHVRRRFRLTRGPRPLLCAATTALRRRGSPAAQLPGHQGHGVVLRGARGLQVRPRAPHPLTIFPPLRPSARPPPARAPPIERRSPPECGSRDPNATCPRVRACAPRRSCASTHRLKEFMLLEECPPAAAKSAPKPKPSAAAGGAAPPPPPPAASSGPAASAQ